MTDNSFETQAIESMISRWVEIEANPRIIFDMEWNIIWNSNNFESFCQATPLVQLKKRRVEVKENSLKAAIVEFWRSELAICEFWIEKSKLNHDPIMISMALLKADGIPYLGLRFSEPAHERIRLSLIEEIYGLTDAEIETLYLLYRGNNVKETSDYNSVSVETTRTHVRQIYQKMGVSSREKLFALLNSFIK